MPSKYTFMDYSPGWPRDFDREASSLRNLIGNELIDIHHIGSTSVPGLAAKPIIDLLTVARNMHRIDECTAVFEEAGFKAWGAYGLPGRRYFTKDRDAFRALNVHIYQMGNPEIERHLAFRDYLRMHDHLRDEYASLKREVYDRHPDDITAYNNAKDAWIRRVEQLALEWFCSAK